MQAFFKSPIPETLLCLKRKMAEKLSETTRMLGSDQLADLMQHSLDKILVIDSRSFLEYNTCHVLNSVNVGCSKLIKRRLQQDKVTIRELLSSSCQIDTDDSCEVIVYDQNTQHVSGVQAENFLSVLLSKLSGTFKSVSLLTGGFAAFQSCFPTLCETQGISTKCSALAPLSQPCMPVTNVGPTKILPFLFIGSQQDVLNQEVMHRNGIEYVLNISKTCPQPEFLPDGHFCRIPVNDNYREKILPWFNKTVDFIDKVHSLNGKVIVHCLAGVSRSATVAIAYVMNHLRMSSDDAYRYVKDKRPTISPNFNFLGQLLEFEKRLKEDNKGPDSVITHQPYSSRCGDVITPQPRSPSPYRDTTFQFNRPHYLAAYETDNEPTERKRTKVSNIVINIPGDSCVPLPQGKKSPQRPTGLDVGKVSQFGPTLQEGIPLSLPRAPSPSSRETTPAPTPTLSFPSSATPSPLEIPTAAQLFPVHCGRPVSQESLQQVNCLTSALSVNSPVVQLENPFATRKTDNNNSKSVAMEMQQKNETEKKALPVKEKEEGVKVEQEIKQDQKTLLRTTHKSEPSCPLQHVLSKNCETGSQQTSSVGTKNDTWHSDNKARTLGQVNNGGPQKGISLLFMPNPTKTEIKQSDSKPGKRDSGRQFEWEMYYENQEKRESSHDISRQQVLGCLTFPDTSPWATKVTTVTSQCNSLRQEECSTKLKRSSGSYESLKRSSGSFESMECHHFQDIASLKRSSGSFESMECHFQDIASDGSDSGGRSLGSQRALCGSCEMIEVS
ncbi:uncharacterized protein LOC144452664 [Glandiceps talaboti]